MLLPLVIVGNNPTELRVTVKIDLKNQMEENCISSIIPLIKPIWRFNITNFVTYPLSYSNFYYQFVIKLIKI